MLAPFLILFFLPSFIFFSPTLKIIIMLDVMSCLKSFLKTVAWFQIPVSPLNSSGAWGIYRPYDLRLMPTSLHGCEK